MKEARPAAEDGDEDDEESRDLGHHLQLVPRGVQSPPWRGSRWDAHTLGGGRPPPEEEHAKDEKASLPRHHHHSKLNLIARRGQST